LAAALKVGNLHELPTRVSALSAELKNMEKEITRMKDEAANAQVAGLFQNAEEVGGIKIFSLFLSGTAPDALRKMCDRVREETPASVAAIFGEVGGKVTLAVCCGSEAVKRGLAAGKLVKEIASVAGGTGGGKPDFAMAGIKDATKIDEAIAAVPGIVRGMLAL
ncbi:MAG: DHHA1 domain-containing protein, partial [Oscillospiraceae bacterium]